MVVVWNGRIRFELNDRRGDAALGVIDPVYIIGEGRLLAEQRHRLSVVAAEEVDANLIDGRLLREHGRCEPRLRRALLPRPGKRARRSVRAPGRDDRAAVRVGVKATVVLLSTRVDSQSTR